MFREQRREHLEGGDGVFHAAGLVERVGVNRNLHPASGTVTAQHRLREKMPVQHRRTGR